MGPCCFDTGVCCCDRRGHLLRPLATYVDVRQSRSTVSSCIHVKILSDLTYTCVNRSRKPFGNIILVKPYPHAAPYFIGMLTGYLLHTHASWRPSRRWSVIGWIAAIFMSLLFTFVTWEWNKG